MSASGAVAWRVLLVLMVLSMLRVGVDRCLTSMSVAALPVCRVRVASASGSVVRRVLMGLMVLKVPIVLSVLRVGVCRREAPLRVAALPLCSVRVASASGAVSRRVLIVMMALMVLSVLRTVVDIAMTPSYVQVGRARQ